MFMAERGGDNQIKYGEGKPDGIIPWSEIHRKGAEAGMALIMFGQLLLAGCQKGIDPTDTVGPTEPAITQPWTPTPEGEIVKTPTEYMIPGISTEIAPAPTPIVVETPPPQLEGGALFLPGVSLGAGGPELQNVALSAVQSAVNAAGFGIVGSEGNASAKSGNMCITIVPEQLNNPSLPDGVESLNREKSANGVAMYEETQVLMQVPLPKDSADATYACALGYARDNNPEYEDGTLRQLLVETTADGTKVIASMPAGFSRSEDVAVLGETVFVDGKEQGWTVVAGETLPSEQSWSLEIPATPEQCTNVIRSDTFEHTMEDVTSLNKYIMEQRPEGEVFPELNIPRISSHFVSTTGIAAYDFIDIDSNSPYASEYHKLLSCSRYGDGIVYGMFLPVGKEGENQTLIPVQVFLDSSLTEQIFINLGENNPNFEQLVMDNNNQGLTGSCIWRLYGHFADIADQYANSLSAIYGRYLDETYDYSNRLLDLMTRYGVNPERDKETIELLQKIMITGVAGPVPFQ